METAKHSRKCAGCGQWSAWHQSPDDICEHCGEILDPKGAQARQQRNEEMLRQKDQLNISLIEIHPSDSASTKFGKRIIQAFQLSLIAIISFIIWLVTVLAG